MEGSSLPAPKLILTGVDHTIRACILSSSMSSPSKTLFERIAEGDIPADFLHKDDLCIAFRDINPQAPVHFLVVPRKPIPTLDDLTVGDQNLVGHLFLVAQKVAAAEGLTGGYRAVFNCREDAFQTVPHVHLHILGGRKMGWPPG